jgi:hypothetical protein
MDCEFHLEARHDYFEAIKFYSSISRGLGAQFTSEIETAICKVTEHPLRWPILYQVVRRYLTPTFPYAILYASENDRIFIVAVMHTKRNPDYWKHRLS